MKLSENDHVSVCHHRYSIEVIRSLISIQATLNGKYLSVFSADEEFPDSVDGSVEKNDKPGQDLIKAV